MYLGRIRSVWYISLGDRAIIATCSLRTSTDRLKANDSVDVVSQADALYPSQQSHFSIIQQLIILRLYPSQHSLVWLQYFQAHVNQIHNMYSERAQSSILHQTVVYLMGQAWCTSWLRIIYTSKYCHRDCGRWCQILLCPPHNRMASNKINY